MAKSKTKALNYCNLKIQYLHHLALLEVLFRETYDHKFQNPLTTLLITLGNPKHKHFLTLTH